MQRQAILIGGVMGTCLMLGACGSEPAAQDQAAAPAPEKIYGRPGQMYQGQGHVQSIQSASVAPGKDGAVVLKASVTVPGEGYKNGGFLPYIYAGSPPDGIYTVDVVADAPATPGAAAPTTMEVEGAWDKYTDGRVKGIRFVSATNKVVAMLPAAGSPAAPAAK
jgi:hypothetical protein